MWHVALAWWLVALRSWRGYATNCFPHDIYSGAAAARFLGLTRSSVKRLGVSEELPGFRGCLNAFQNLRPPFRRVVSPLGPAVEGRDRKDLSRLNAREAISVRSRGPPSIFDELAPNWRWCPVPIWRMISHTSS